MMPDALFLLVGGLAAVFAGISKAGFGSGAGFAATPLLALVLPPEAAVAVMLPVMMLIDVTALRAYRGRWSPPEAWRLILWSVPGVALGAAFWTVADAAMLKLTIGLLALGFVVFQAAGALGLIGRGRFFASEAAAGALGVAAGFVGFVAHAGGPPTAVYLLARGLGKTAYQATTVIFFFVMNLMKAALYSVMGIFTTETLVASLWLMPAALLGAWLGVVAHRAVPERPFFAITYALLIVVGGKLVTDALGA